MYDQPNYKPLARSRLWADGRSSRPPVEGAVARSEGTFAGTTSGRLGEVAPAPRPGPLDTVRPGLRPDADAAHAGPASLVPAAPPPRCSRAGRERFDIFCAPCHGTVGDGDGMVARRGFPAPPSYHNERLRAGRRRALLCRHRATATA